jgi:hypothetical protein
VGRLFTDSDKTYRIIAIDRNGKRTTGVGRNTLFYKYYDINEHVTPPTDDDDYEHTPCAKFKRDNTNTWITEAEAGTALMAQSLTSAMMAADSPLRQQ